MRYTYSLYEHGLRQWLSRLVVIFLATLSAPAIAQTESDIKNWLKWLGVTRATLQADRVIAQEVSQYSERQAINAELAEQLQKKLLASVGGQVLTDSVTAYVIEKFPASHGDLAKIMRSPLFLRARNFDIALEMKGAFKKFETFENKQIQDAPSAKRITLLKQLDKALRTSQFAALIQTELNTITGEAAANLTGKSRQATDPQWLSLQRKQRERYMSDVIVRLNLFSYRFMKDSELEDYIKLLQNGGVQLLLDLAERGIQKSLTTTHSTAVK